MNGETARRIVQGTLSAEMYRKSPDYPFSFSWVPGPGAPQMVEVLITGSKDAYGYYPASFTYLDIITGPATWDIGQFSCIVWTENDDENLLIGKRYHGRLQGNITEGIGLQHEGETVVTVSHTIPDAGCGLGYQVIDDLTEEYYVDVASLAGDGIGVQTTVNGCDKFTINAASFYTFLGCGLNVATYGDTSLIVVDLTAVATDGLIWDPVTCSLYPNLGCGLHIVTLDDVDTIAVDVSVLAGDQATTSLISTSPDPLDGCPYLGVDLVADTATTEDLVTNVNLAMVNGTLRLSVEKTTYENFYNLAGLLLYRNPQPPVVTNTDINTCLFQTCCEAGTLLAVIGYTVDGSEVEFTGTATNGVAPITWLWDFGDGTTSTAQNPSHTYGASGTYTVQLTVTDSCGRTASTTQDVSVVVPSCCDDTIPDDIWIAFSNVSGCPDVDGLVVHLQRVGLTNVWSMVPGGFTGGTGGCAMPTLVSFNCETGAINAVWGADNTGTTTVTAWSCDPLLVEFEIDLSASMDTTCCGGTMSGIITETEP